MSLTRRQHEVLSNFLDLYHRNKEPLHYTTIAEHLQINPVSAYSMLRLLEERGLLTSEFAPPSHHRGVGRARVVFSPTAEARTLVSHLVGEDWRQEEWQVIREQILEALRAGKGSGYEHLMDDLVGSLAEQRSPLRYTAEMITAVILQVYQITKGAKESPLLDNIRNLGLPGDLGSNLMKGLITGLSYVERANKKTIEFLLAHASRYQEMLGRLNRTNRRRLADFIGEVMDIVSS